MSIESEFRQVLGEMEVFMSYGTVMDFASSRGGDGGSGRPPGEAWPAHLEWRERWDRAFNKNRVLEEARDALRALSKQRQQAIVPETAADLEARMIREGDGWAVREVALHFNCTPTFVRRVRLTAGVNAATGEPSAASVEAAVSEAQRASELAREGLSERQIRLILGCGGSKARRLLGKAA